MVRRCDRVVKPKVMTGGSPGSGPHSRISGRISQRHDGFRAARSARCRVLVLTSLFPGNSSVSPRTTRLYGRNSSVLPRMTPVSAPSCSIASFGFNLHVSRTVSPARSAFSAANGGPGSPSYSM